MNNDLISRSALLKAFENNIDTDVCQEDADYQYLWGFSWETVERAIQEAPAVDAVEVVRCKDCRHCRRTEWNIWCSIFDKVVPEEGFCNFGERRAEDATD